MLLIIVQCLLIILLKKFPPKKINPLYGYRTSRSMKSESHWQLANSTFNRCFIRLNLLCIVLEGMLLMVACQFNYTATNHPFYGLLSLALLFSTLIASIIKTEIALRKFDFNSTH